MASASLHPSSHLLTLGIYQRMTRNDLTVPERETVAVDVILPPILHASTGGRSVVQVNATTLQGCFDALFQAFPLLQRHLFAESGEQRPHVLFFYNDENTRWLDSLEIPVRPGDSLSILQAVSGG